MRAPGEAIAWARAHPSGWEDDCLKFVRTAYDLPLKGYDDAAEARTDTRNRGTGAPVFGALLWWTGGSQGHGHAALALGNGRCLSTDFGPTGFIGDGRVRDIPIENVAKQSSCVYRGWSRDYGGTIVVPATEQEDDEVTDADIAKITAAVEAKIRQDLRARGLEHEKIRSDLAARAAEHTKLQADVDKIKAKLGV